MKPLILVALLFVLLSGGTATAQEIVALEKGQSVWSVMADNGCNFSWLSQVLKDSNIEPANVRRLPIGQAVNLSTCSAGAPKQVLAESLAVLRADQGVTEVTSEVTADLKSQLDDVNSRVIKAEGEVTRLQGEVARLQAEAENVGLARQKAEREANTAKEEAATLRKKGTVGNGNGFWASLWMIGGMALAAVIFIMLARAFLRKRVFSPKNKLVNIRGRTLELSLGQVEVATTGEQTRLWRCPHCPALLPDDDIQQHTETNHMDAAGLVTSN